ncbi:MAG: hypothetical protein MI922_01100, partial [Bacteroidales bacterium]|nr:hypothetical protein [Bacteroidales bacterium]
IPFSTLAQNDPYDLVLDAGVGGKTEPGNEFIDSFDWDNTLLLVTVGLDYYRDETLGLGFRFTGTWGANRPGPDDDIRKSKSYWFTGCYANVGYLLFGRERLIKTLINGGLGVVTYSGTETVEDTNNNTERSDSDQIFGIGEYIELSFDGGKKTWGVRIGIGVMQSQFIERLKIEDDSYKIDTSWSYLSIRYRWEF